MKAAKTLAGLVVALCLGMAASVSYAQSIDGPFVSKQQLVDFWQTKAIKEQQATLIALNGYKVFSSGGFGPSMDVKYFQCSDGLIYTKCNSIKGPFSNRNQIISAVSDMLGNEISSTTIRVDGNIILGASFSPGSGSFNYKTCPAPYSYMVLDQAYTSYGSITGISCLPQL